MAITLPTPTSATTFIAITFIPVSAHHSSEDVPTQQPPPSVTIQPSTITCQTLTVPPRPLPDQQSLNFSWDEHSDKPFYEVINSSYEE